MTMMTECFGEPIVTLTRAGLLADGELVDVSATAREAGFRLPVAITHAAWLDCVEWSEADNLRKSTYQDQAGRLWDVLWMASVAVKTSRSASASRLVFELHRVPRSGRGRAAKRTTLVVEIGPGDAGEPVLTVMLPGED